MSLRQGNRSDRLFSAGRLKVTDRISVIRPSRRKAHEREVAMSEKCLPAAEREGRLSVALAHDEDAVYLHRSYRWRHGQSFCRCYSFCIA